LRIKVRTARRLMFAHRMKELLKAHGRLLPVSEGSVRPLLEELREDRQRTKIKLTLEELQLKAWDIACLMKQKSTPTGTDVRRADARRTGVMSPGSYPPPLGRRSGARIRTSSIHLYLPNRSSRSCPDHPEKADKEHASPRRGSLPPASNQDPVTGWPNR
jgi:hypothetical protein